jgi:hypothetical protein
VDRARGAGDDRGVDASQGTARRFCLAGAILFTGLLFLVPIIGQEINGAQRWIGVGFTQFQPSEFLKPMFVVSLAWLLSLRDQDKSLPVVPLSGIVTGLIALLLMQQPNFGETIIFAGGLGDAAGAGGRADAFPDDPGRLRNGRSRRGILPV